MSPRIRSFIAYFLVSAATSGLCLWQLHGSYGFNLADEGFFWYGAKQTARGEIPGLDFMAYEPGRYYWAAALFNALGNDSNIMARIASVLFGSLLYGAITTWLIEQRKDFGRAKAAFAIVFLPSALSIWSFPYYRITDTVAPCLSFLLCYQQYEDRRKKTSLITGIWIGVLMFFGRNHALYALLGIAIVLLHLHLQERDIRKSISRIRLGAMGIATGIAPFYIISLAKPEYPATIIGQWIALLKTGKTNLSLPWPLPWRTITSRMPLSEADGHLLIGILFMSVFAIGIAGTIAIAIASTRGEQVYPELIAMTAATAGYLHYCIERADMEHISPALMPALMGVFLWGMRGKKIMTVACTLSILIPSVRVAARQQSAYHCMRQTIQCKTLTIDRHTKVQTSFETAQLTESALEAIRGSRFLAAPAYPSLYAMTATRSPIWDIYAAWPRTQEEQVKAIAAIQAFPIDVILINKDAFGKDASFEHNNPLLYSYLTRTYKECKTLTGSNVRLLRKRHVVGCSSQNENRQ